MLSPTVPQSLQSYSRSKTLSFHRCLQFWEEEKVSGGQVRLSYDYGFVFGQKLKHKHRCMSWCVIMVQNPWLVLPQFCPFLTNCFVQSAYSFKVLFPVDHTTLRQEFMMHHAIAIKENSKQNLHIWPNLTCFFRSWFFWTLPLGRLGFDFNVIAIRVPPMIRKLFEQIWIVAECRQHSYKFGTMLTLQSVMVG